MGARAKAWAVGAASAALGYVYPPSCPACRGALAEPGGLCPECWKEVTFISGAACRACGAPVAGQPGPDQVCDGCAHAPPAWDKGAAAVVYDGAGRRLVLALKHGDRLDVAPLAAGWMMRAGADLLAETDLIVPAPLHWRRFLRRRYNQSGELARELEKMAGRPAALDLLRRTRATGTQDGKSRTDRFANVAGAFRASERAAGRRILLIDDVMTTGATLSACAEACRAAGAVKVNVLALARVARADWPT